MFNEFRVSAPDDGRVLDVDHGGGGGPTSQLCLMPLNCTLKNYLNGLKKLLSRRRRSFPFKVQFHFLFSTSSLGTSSRAE